MFVIHLMIKISERRFIQYFDDSMLSFSSEKRIKFDNLIYIPCEVMKRKSVHVNSDKFK